VGKTIKQKSEGKREIERPKGQNPFGSEALKPELTVVVKTRQSCRELPQSQSKSYQLLPAEMGMSKTEVNFRRLLAAAPQQQNHSKLVHYVATLRELLEKLAEEKTPEGLPRVSKAVVNDYSAKIEEIASKPDIKVPQEPGTRNSFKQSPNSDAESHMPSSPGLRRRAVPTSSIKDRTQDITEAHTSAPVKLDAAAEAHIQKHRYHLMLLLPIDTLSQLCFLLVKVKICLRINHDMSLPEGTANE
ncbi:Vesicle transport protein, partial [Theobroma cacao]